MILGLKMTYLPHSEHNMEWPKKSKTATFAYSLMDIISTDQNNEFLGIVHPCSYRQSPTTSAHAVGVSNSAGGLGSAVHSQ